MRLGQLISALSLHPNQNAVVPMGFDNPHSYRGFYEDVAFEPAMNVTIGAMLTAAQEALGSTYQGYKGGDFTMTWDTSCWLAHEGCTGETLGPNFVRMILEGAK